MSEFIQTTAELGLTPVKSTMRTNPDKLVFDENGMFGDRELMFVEAAEGNLGKFTSQRADGTMALIRAELVDERINLDHPDAGQISLFRNEESPESVIPVSVDKWNGYGVDQGNEVAEWSETVFGRPVRLVRVSEANPRFVENNPHLGRVGFSDGYPLLVLSRGSVKAISDFMEEQGDEPIDARNFGPNILLDVDEPFVEDKITSISFESEGLVWEFIRRKACGRCKMPSRNPDTGEMRKVIDPGSDTGEMKEGTSVLNALALMGRKGVHINNVLFGSGKGRFFGQNFIIRPPTDIEPRGVGLLRPSTELTAYVSDKKNWQQVA